MTTSTQAVPSWSTARRVQVERRERDQARLSEAIKIGQQILDEATALWVSPREFLNRLATTAKVDQYTAQVVFDDLASAHKMEFVVGRGVRRLPLSD